MSSNKNRGPLAARGVVSETKPDPLEQARLIQEENDKRIADEEAKRAEALRQQAEQDQAALNQAQEAQVQGVADAGTIEGVTGGDAASIPEPEVLQPVVREFTGVSEVLNEPAAESPVVKEEEVTRPPSIQARMTAHNNVSQARQDTPEAVPASQFVPEAEFSAMMHKERTSGTGTAISLVLFMDKFVNDMAPRRPQSTESILGNQESLFFKIMEIIERSPSREFDRLWRILIAYFAQYSTQCFAPKYVLRGSREWRRSSEDFALFVRLLNLLSASGTGRTSDVSVETTSREGLSEEGRGRLVAFYLK